MARDVLVTLAQQIYEFREVFPRGYVKDVYAWDDGAVLRFAWVMPAEKLRQLIGYTEDNVGKLPFQGPYVHYIAGRKGFTGDIFRYEREQMDVFDFLDRMPTLINSSERLDTDGEYIDARVTFIPEPGYPWPHRYYSVKKRKFIDPPKPTWLLDEPLLDESTQRETYGVDFCKLMETPKEFDIGATVANFGRDYMIVTHAMGTMSDITRFGSWSENAAMVNRCGGLLFPSMAIGEVPAANFGPFILVADIGLLLNSLKPTLKGGQSPLMAVYDTDVWSATTKTFFQDAAISAFEQMTGQDDYMSYLDQNIWPLGAPQAPELHGPGLADRLETVAQVKRTVRERHRTWKRSLTPEQVQAVNEEVALTKHRYAYLEGKVNTVRCRDIFPLAVCPEQAQAGFRGFLDATGFHGRLLPVALPAEVLAVMAEGSPGMRPWLSPEDLNALFPDWKLLGSDRKEAVRTWAWMQYAWHVADAVREAGRHIDI